MGDPAGIGPEIIVKAAQRLAPRLAEGSLRLLVIGSRSALDNRHPAHRRRAHPRRHPGLARRPRRSPLAMTPPS